MNESAESQAKFKQYLSNTNPSFADSTDLLAPSNRSHRAFYLLKFCFMSTLVHSWKLTPNILDAPSHYGPVESPAHSTDGHDIPSTEPAAADARSQGIRFSLQVPPIHRGAR